MIKCVTQKKIYHTEEPAEEALLGAHIRFDYAPGHGPISIYRCDDCGYFHLTSRGPMSTSLALQLKRGKIDRQKEADAWEKKLKH
jgi:hypothetical protein